MKNFEFFSIPRICFGSGEFSKTGERAASLGIFPLVVHNGPEELADRLCNILQSAGIRHARFRQRGEPTVRDINSAIEMAGRHDCDGVIGLGGGSAIDAAKAVAGLMTNGGSALDYMEVIGAGQSITRPGAPWMAIPTTAGTGAEVTRNAVIGAPEKQFKASIRGEKLLARIAIIDPEIGISTPPEVTAASGMDALCQCIEAYVSLRHNPMTDALALQGIRLAARSLHAAYLHGSDINARQEMALAALFSGIALTNAGLGAVHGFAAPLGANFPVPHGVVRAALLPGVMAANIAALRDEKDGEATLARYADVGRALFGSARSCAAGPVEAASSPLPASGEAARTPLPQGAEPAPFAQGYLAAGPADDAQAIEAAITISDDLAQKMRIPRLGKYGLSAEQVPAMATLAKKASSMRSNPVQLAEGVLCGILLAAI